MERQFLRESAFVIATLASVAFLASQGGAVASTSLTSPYSILAPVVATSASQSNGRAAHKQRVSSCSLGERDVPTDFGWRCVPAW
jgi:hypothetical protein